MNSLSSFILNINTEKSSTQFCKKCEESKQTSGELKQQHLESKKDKEIPNRGKFRDKNMLNYAV